MKVFFVRGVEPRRGENGVILSGVPRGKAGRNAVEGSSTIPAAVRVRGKKFEILRLRFGRLGSLRSAQEDGVVFGAAARPVRHECRLSRDVRGSGNTHRHGTSTNTAPPLARHESSCQVSCPSRHSPIYARYVESITSNGRSCPALDGRGSNLDDATSPRAARRTRSSGSGRSGRCAPTSAGATGRGTMGS